MSMAFGRQKRLLLGLLALLVALPLPFNDVVEWPVAFAYFAGVGFFLRRASLDPPRWLPLWGLNVLGLVYLPIFTADLLVLSRDRLVLPVVHLGLFALLVKLFALTRERDKWQAALGIFFLFLAAMGTSVHPTIVLYLLAFMVLGLALLVRFAFFHVLAGFGRSEAKGGELAGPPIAGFLVGAAVLTVALAMPLFALLPRVRNPYIVGRAGGTGTVIEAAGFSDDVTLDSIGKIRDGQGVAMRLLGTAEVLGSEPRFKAATYDLYLGGRWRRSPLGEPLSRSRGVRFRLSDEPVVDWVRIFLQPLRSRSLPLPIAATVVEPRVASLDIDKGGAVALGYTPIEIVEYRVGVAARPVMTGEVPGLDPLDPTSEPTLDTGGVSPRMSELARRVMGQGSAADRAGRLESHLVQNYGYTRDFEGRTTDDPLDDFLFKYRTGQCEYFASSMVLLLRSQGIPARLVTGFLGGEYNPFEGYTIVRDGNAHAWVEAYLGPAGWRTFDPTPPAGRPAEGGEGTWPLLRQAWDYVLFRWDRYVLTFGLYDQLRILGDLSRLWHGFWRQFAHDPGVYSPPQAGSTASAPPIAMPPAGAAERRLGRGQALMLGGLLVLFALVAWRLVLRYRPPLTATGAYRQLRRLFGRPGGVVLPASAPPLAFRREATRRYPRAAEPAATIVDLYLRESFGGVEMGEEEREVLKAALEEVERGMKKAG